MAVGLQKTVLVCDDSVFMRTIIKKILTEDGRFMVVGTASDGIEAVEMAEALRPDCITMDLQMPKMDGAQATAKIVQKHPIPILIVSSVAESANDLTVRALENGAVDYVLKPGSRVEELQDNRDFPRDLIAKLWGVVGAKVKVPRSNITPASTFKPMMAPPKTGGERVVVIGASTGGPPTLIEIIVRFPARFPFPIIIVQHMHGGFTKSLATRLDRVGHLRAKEAEQGERAKGGMIYLANGEKNLEIIRQRGDIFFKLSPFQGQQLYKPSINLLFLSAVQVFGHGVRACLLTGMGDDGADGMEAVAKAGGLNFVQEERSCAVYGMPKAANERRLAHFNAKPEEFFPLIQGTL